MKKLVAAVVAAVGMIALLAGCGDTVSSNQSSMGVPSEGVVSKMEGAVSHAGEAVSEAMSRAGEAVSGVVSGAEKTASEVMSAAEHPTDNPMDPVGSVPSVG